MGQRETRPQNDLSEPTDVRFGVRGLLVTMTCVAVGAAVLGMSFRKLQPEARGTVLVLWGVCLAIVLCSVVYLARRRFRLEREAGRTLQRLSARWKWGVAAASLFWISLGLYYLVVMAMTAHSSPPRGREPLMFSVLVCVACASMVAYGITSFWWNRVVQLRENGVLRGLRLLRWTHITSHRWQHGSVYFQGVDQRHRDLELAAVAHSDQRDAVIRLLDQKLPARERAMNQDLDDPPLPLVEIDVHRHVSFRGLASAFAFYIVFNAILLVIFRPFGPPSREFLWGLGAGIAGSLLVAAFGSRRVGAAGAPLVRLRTRFDWPSIVAAVLIASGCFVFQKVLLFPHWVVAGGLGAGTGVAVAALGGMILRDKFDLCENGVMLIPSTFLPWAGVRLVKWHRRGNGRLVLQSGWRRIAARVPRERRAAVEAILRDKLGARIEARTMDLRRTGD